MLRIGIAGFGFMGRTHYQCWKKLEAAEVVAVCDTNPNIVEDTKKAVGNIGDAKSDIDFETLELYTEFDKMLHEAKLDAVSITLPTFLHPEFSVCHKDIRACDHIPGRTYNDELCHYIMRDVVSVLEGSVVFSASQGTGFVNARGNGNRPTVSEALKAAREAHHRPIEIVSSRAPCRIDLPWLHFAEE